MKLAQDRFRSEVRDYLADEEIEEFRGNGTILGGSIVDDWTSELGSEPDERLHYEYQFYRPSDECPYVEKYYARILVTRDRASEAVWIKWKPPVPEYDGPWYE